MLLKDLQAFGFSKNLSTVYLAVFEAGEVKAGEIIRKTGLHRNLVYTALEKLEQKKLITKVSKRGVARYKALDPEKLLGELQERENLAKHIIESLQALHNPTKQEVIVHEGIEELRRKELALYSLPKKGENFYILGLSPDWYKTMGKETVKKIANLQNERGYFLKALGAFSGKDDLAYMAATPGLSEFRAKDVLSTESTEIAILPDRVVISLFVEPYTSIEIINKEMVKSYRQYFEALWDQSIETINGWEQAKAFFLERIAPTLSKNTTECLIGAQYPNVSYKDEFQELFIEYNGIGVKQGFNKKMLLYEKDREQAMQELAGAGDISGKHLQTMFLPDTFASPLGIHIWEDAVAVCAWEEVPSITVYHSQTTIEGFQKQFDLLWNQETQTYTGLEEIEKLYFEVLLAEQEPGSTVYTVGAGYGKSGNDEQVRDFYIRFNRARTQKGVHKKIIFSENHRKESKEEFIEAGDPSFSFVEFRYLPESYYSAIQIHISKGRATLVAWGETPVATVYENPDIVAGFKKQFDYLWNQETQTYSGWKEIERLFFDKLLASQKPGDTEYNLGAGYGMPGTEDKVRDFYLRYNTARTAKKVHKKLIFCEQHRAESRDEFIASGDPEFNYVELKYIPQKYYTAMQTHIIGNAAVLVMWGPNPVATVYHNTDIVDALKKQFDLMWEIATD